jgi:hypothetical protein
MNDTVYIEMPAPAKQKICSCQDWKDYGTQIGIVAAVFLAALVGLIIILLRSN